MKWPKLTYAFFLIVLFIFQNLTIAQSISGKISDKETGEVLIGSNVMLIGTSIGAASDFEGAYVIKSVQAGEYKIKASFLGYKPLIKDITVVEGKKIILDFVLEFESLQGETIVVTAQALGQKQAINQQLSSKNIKNIVSSARIKEVPDANAAESVGRLPGVSLLREGGEGNKVVIRGLEPKFNAITINGVSLSSSDAGDRSTDLSMISSSMLAGIEVSKSITPDMDANVIGGTVNFQLRDATTNISGKPIIALNVQGGYNGLSNARENFKNFKIDASFENRFLDNDLGLFVQGSYENRNLSSNELGAQYDPMGVSEEDYLINNIFISDIFRMRERGNAVLSLDYKLPQGKIKFSNLLSTSTTETNSRGQAYLVDKGSNTQRFSGMFSENTLNSISNILNFENQFSIFDVKTSLSHSYSESKAPNSWDVRFSNTPANIEKFASISNADPKDVVKAANNDLENTLLQTITATNTFGRERSLAASIDLETQFNLSDYITSTIKFGGKYQHKKRSYNSNTINGDSFGLASGAALIDQLQNNISWFNHSPGDNVNVQMNQFVDHNFDYGSFLDDDYEMVYPLDFDRLHEMINFMNNNLLDDNITYNKNIGASLTNDYEGTEDISAAYIMATINIGPKLTIIPGVRYQELRTSYTAPQGLQGPFPFSSYEHKLKTVTESHSYFLPDVLVQYKPFDWFDVRLAYTNTLSYPDYAALTPRINVALTGNSLAYNGFNLKPMESKNYDAYFSFYNNTVGLFTVGAFLKEMKDLIYQYTFTPATSDDLIVYYPDWVANKNPKAGVNVTRWLNNSFKVDNYGIELDWQTHFWYLPSVLSGLVFNINYTHIFSEAEYPVQVFVREGRRVVPVDSSFIAPLLFQPDDILNITIGYDYEDFSLRVSMLYSSDVFTGPRVYPQLRASTDSYTRYDLTMKQKLSFIMEGFEVFLNYNNISGADDASSISAQTSAPTRIQSYGSMIELGLRSQF
ncbi:MAG: TonB-dependent receptor [Melioribacteraceae bacterium]|nr:TonB-dependent receptor [Melioribacteraceae bacterium]